MGTLYVFLVFLGEQLQSTQHAYGVNKLLSIGLPYIPSRFLTADGQLWEGLTRISPQFDPNAFTERFCAPQNTHDKS